jgi:hypothetical protein
MSSRVTGILRKSVSGDTPDKRGRSATFGEDAFANLAIGLIGRFVREVRVDAPKSFRIVFSDESEIMISLRSEHYEGPEAVDFQGRNYPGCGKDQSGGPLLRETRISDHA